MQKSARGEFKIFDAADYRVGIVIARFNADITTALLENAREKLAAYGVRPENIIERRVAGSIELPVALQALAQIKQYDCLIAIGAVVRGATPHFDYVCNIASEGILRVMLDYTIPIGFGVLTLERPEQAAERFIVGGWAAEAALQAARGVREIQNKS